MNEVDLMSDYETCDVCGKRLNIHKGEDFFVEDEKGSHVYCSEHWAERHRKQKELD